MADLGSNFYVGGTLTFYAITKDGGPVDADDLPTYRIYEHTTDTPLVTGSFAKLDDTNTTGWYRATITLTEADGFEFRKTYSILKTAVIDGVTYTSFDTFFIGTSGPTALAVVAGYPQTADLAALISSLGLAAQTETNMTYALNEIIGLWEDLTGYQPFITSGVDSTRLLDPPGPQRPVAFSYMGNGSFLDFRGGLVSVTSIVVEDYTYTSGTDYYLYPLNASDLNKPYEWALFMTRLRGRPQSVEVTGKWGYCEALPGRVFAGILREALHWLFPHYLLAEGGDVIEEEQRGVRFKYSNEGKYKGPDKSMTINFRQLLTDYSRVGV